MKKLSESKICNIPANYNIYNKEISNFIFIEDLKSWAREHIKELSNYSVCDDDSIYYGNPAIIGWIEDNILEVPDEKVK